MNSLFGIPMNTIMGILLGILGIALLGIAVAGLRHPVLLKLGLRNMPRRRAQTLIIVLGLMVSTLIITTAFAIGDSFNYTITRSTYTGLGPVDETILFKPAGADADNPTHYAPAAAVTALEAAVGATPEIVAWLPSVREPLPALNPRTRLQEPRVSLVGFDPETVARLGNLASARGGQNLSLAALGPAEVYVNATAADKLDAKPGDRITVSFANQPHTLLVKGVVKDSLLGGFEGPQSRNNAGLVTSLANVRAVTGRADDYNALYVSNRADAHAGLPFAKPVTERLKGAIQSPAVQAALSGSGVSFEAQSTKLDAINLAVRQGNQFTTFFLIFGLFSIASGLMLIFLIFVMLAAERRPEMGMARAVGITRLGLVQSFLAEGMTYNLLAGLVGVLLGTGVAFGFIAIADRIFGGDFQVAGHASPRSLVVSYCLGAVLTFLTVGFSAYRTTRMNIVAAIRDLPEEKIRDISRRRVRWDRVVRGAAIIAGSIVLVLAPSLFEGVIVLVALLAGLGILLGATLLETRRPLGIVARVLLSLVGNVGWGFFMILRGFGLSWSMIWGVICLLIGLVSIPAGHFAKSVFLFTEGASLAPLGLALILRARGLPVRPVFSVLGLYLLVFWLQPSSVFKGFVQGASGGPEMFFLSGIMIVLGTTLAIVFNGELLARLVNRLGGRLGSLRPSLATAIAYPMASRLRTGLTLAMFSLIIFSVTVFATINANFGRLLLNGDARGGWDVAVTTNPNNPIGNLTSAARNAGVDTSSFAAAGGVSGASGFVEVRNAGSGDWRHYLVRAADDAYLQAADTKLQTHLKDLSGDSEPWQRLRAEPNTAIIDAFATSPNGPDGSNSPDFKLAGVKANTKLLDKPVDIEVRGAGGKVGTLHVIGVIKQAVIGDFGIYTSDATYASILGAPVYTDYSLRLVKGADDRAITKSIRAGLGAQGVQAESIRETLRTQQQQSDAFGYLFEGFMGLGLLVGIAAVAVIAARTVVERRQQIGMLRAVGYQRGQVALSFALETSFIALFGILAGVVTACILAHNLFTGGVFGNTAGVSFTLPYTQIVIFAGSTYIAALAMTYFPSRRAASVPIAQALRYE